MTYNVFGGTLNLAQSSPESVSPARVGVLAWSMCLLQWVVAAARYQLCLQRV